MAEKIKLVKNDTKPALILSLTDEDSGDPIDIATATVRMYFRAVGSTAVLATLTATLLPGMVNSDGVIDTASPYDVPGKGGRCVFNWASGDLNQTAGSYEGEVEITFSDASKQTVYDVLKFTLREDFQ